ncbi:MAG: 4Fe-4S dicluster domain-containing protein [Coriobacteriaceae bacterium]|jgi:anaerobic dimethyl sulfoxide reductase subunit B (iron-sulfur subunit)|nr:4Fe-4S dicluster domain-containing protein [Coriobacteriaceae bacterium]
MAQMAFYFDSRVCTGCKACQVACQQKNELPAALVWRRVLTYGGGKWVDKGSHHVPEGVFRYFVSAACNHCAAPACMAVCPVDAIAKDDQTGAVWINQDICIGCGSCETACPYMIPMLDERTGKEVKCDMCRDYLAQDKLPLCVVSCNQRALDFGEQEALQAKYPDTTDAVEPLPLPTTAPSILIRPHQDAQKSGEGTGRILNLPYEY